MARGADTGFGVGHTRATQTKGVWLWAAPQEAVAPGGERLSVVYVDTEGFESTGKCAPHAQPEQRTIHSAPPSCTGCKGALSLSPCREKRSSPHVCQASLPVGSDAKLLGVAD